MTHYVSSIFAVLTILSQLAIVVALIGLLQKNSSWLQRWSGWAVPLAFAVALASTLGSLYYSEIAHFEPCKLCWLQRIFMYPQVILLGLALFKKNRDVALQAIWLSLIGGLIAAAHVLLQWTGISLLPCSAVGQSVSCSKEFVQTFGYVTIPMMSLTAFGLILISALIARRSAQLHPPI